MLRHRRIALSSCRVFSGAPRQLSTARQNVDQISLFKSAAYRAGKLFLVASALAGGAMLAVEQSTTPPPIEDTPTLKWPVEIFNAIGRGYKSITGKRLIQYDKTYSLIISSIRWFPITLICLRVHQPGTSSSILVVSLKVLETMQKRHGYLSCY